MNHEELFIKNFISKGKKERLQSFFESNQNRWKGLLEIEHFNEKVFDMRYAKQPERENWNAVEILEKLKKFGSTDEAYLISCCQEYDKQIYTLEIAINKIVDLGIGTIISCIPGKLAFYESEFGEQAIFSK